MPAVVRRWHLVWSKYPAAARETNDATVAGAFAASRDIGMFPHVVLSVAATVAPVGKLALGAALYCLVPGDPGAGATQVALVTPASEVACGAAAEPLTAVLAATLVEAEPELDAEALSVPSLLAAISTTAPPTATKASTTAMMPAIRLRSWLLARRCARLCCWRA